MIHYIFIQCILRWVKADAQNRKEHLEELMNLIQLNNIPVHTLIDLKNDPLVKTSLKNRIETYINEQLARKNDGKRESDPVKVEKWENLRYGAEQGVSMLCTRLLIKHLDDKICFW